jgi:hypothetical protein
MKKGRLSFYQEIIQQGFRFNILLCLGFAALIKAGCLLIEYFNNFGYNHKSMPRIAGLKLIKSTSGKVTYVTLSRKDFGEIVDN